MIITAPNGKSHIEIGDTGCISRICTEGTEYLKQGSLPSLSLLYSEAASKWEAKGWVELQYRHAAVQRTETGAEIIYEGFGEKNVQVGMTIQANEDEFQFTIQVNNREEGVAVGVAGPVMGGFCDLPGGILYYPDRTGKKLPRPFEELRDEKYCVSYPVPLTMQYITYNTGNQGWSLSFFDRAMLYKNLEVGGNNREIKPVQFCFYEKGDTGTLPPIVLKLYSGTWHTAADRYGAWFRSWSRKHEVSPLVKKLPVTEMVTVLSRPVDDESNTDTMKEMEAGSFERAADFARELKDEGFEAVHMAGWHDRGHDTNFPEFNVSEIAGGRQEMKKMADSIKKMGMQLGYYMNARLGCHSSELYSHNRDWAVSPASDEHLMLDKRKRSGGATEHWGGETFDVVCSCAEGYLHQLKSRVLDLVKNFNADFVQFDQVGAGDGMLCFNKEHGHTTPAAAWTEGYVKMIGECVEEARRIHPDFWLWVEGNWDGIGQVTDLQQGGFMKVYPGDECFFELYRYTFPEYFLMADAFLGGIPFWRGDPSVHAVSYVMKHRAFYSKARFMDNIGLTFNAEHLDVKWHFYDGEIILIAKNNTDYLRNEWISLDLKGVAGIQGVKACSRLHDGRRVKADWKDNVLKLALRLNPKGMDGVFLQLSKPSD